MVQCNLLPRRLRVAKWKSFWFVFVLVVLTKLHTSRSCPESYTDYLTAPKLQERFYFLNYTYDPTPRAKENGQNRRTQTFDKRLRTRPVQCQWRITSSEQDHTVAITFTQSDLSPSSGFRPGDCWRVYDGTSNSDPQLGLVCGKEEGTSQETFHSSGRSLFVTFKQGKRTGPHVLHFQYKSEERKRYTTQIAVIFSCTIAFLGVCFLTLKFTHCCRPCRKRCCPGCTGPMETMEDKEGEEEAAPALQGPRSVTPSAPVLFLEDGFEINSEPPVSEGDRFQNPSAPIELRDGFRTPLSPTVLVEGGFPSPSPSSTFGDLGVRSNEGQFNFAESRARGTDGNGGGPPPFVSPGEGVHMQENIPHPSGFTRPPPAYESIFGDGKG